MSPEGKARQKLIASVLKENAKKPETLARKLKQVIEDPELSFNGSNLTAKDVITQLAGFLKSKRLVRSDGWTEKVFALAGVDVDVQPRARRVVRPVVAAVTPAAPVKRTRKKRRVYLAVTRETLQAGPCTHRELVDKIMGQFPSLNRKTIDTFVTDLTNQKYTAIPDLNVVKKDGGVLALVSGQLN
jgi:hypothetical protein